MNKFLIVVVSFFLGIIATVCAEPIAGRLAAIAIPKGYFNWFNENLNGYIGHIILGIVQDVLSIGIISLMAAYLAASLHRTPWWITATYVYCGVFFYGFLMPAWRYGFADLAPILSAAPVWFLLSLLVIPACIAIGAWYGAKAAQLN